VAVSRVPYASLAALLAREALAAEDAPTRRLIAGLRHVRARGEFSREEFLRMSRWKSPRAAPHYARNSAAAVRRVSRAVLTTRSERRRIELLTALHGVSIPVASAILTLIDPRRYGVLDIRVWQLLHALGAVDRRPSGRGFDTADWERYLACLRPHAARLGASVRLVEYTLFHCHRRFQVGRLYDRVAPSVRASVAPAGARGRLAGSPRALRGAAVGHPRDVPGRAVSARRIAAAAVRRRAREAP
jgi:hypothetical protein